MNGDNGSKDKNPAAETPPEKKTVLTIALGPDGNYQMNSTLPPPITVYVLEMMKMQVLKAIQEPRHIIPAGNKIMRFARGGFKKG